jgi:hypothetical protein
MKQCVKSITRGKGELMMRKLTMTALILLLALPALTGAETENSVWPVQITTKAKWLYTYQRSDNDSEGVFNASRESGAAVENLKTANLEVGVTGQIGNKISFVFEFAAADGFEKNSNPGDIGSAGVRQAYASVSNVIALTSITVGTYNLPASIYQQRPTNQYDLISLPLINTTVFSVNPLAGDDPTLGVGTVYDPVGFGWQVTGVNFMVRPYEKIQIDFSWFNGMGSGGNNNEESLEKSTFINLRFLPTRNSMLSAGIINEGWEELGLNHQEASMTVISGSYSNEKIEANFDWMQSIVEDYMFDDDLELTDIKSSGYQITIGYFVTEKFETLLRYEWVDPNTADDNDSFTAPMSDNDQRTWTTLGLSYFPNENCELALNYIF